MFVCVCICVCLCVPACMCACVKMRRQVCLTWGRRRHIKQCTVIQFTNNVKHFGMCLSGHFSLLLIILPFFFPSNYPNYSVILGITFCSSLVSLSLPLSLDPPLSLYLCHLYPTLCMNWLGTGLFHLPFNGDISGKGCVSKWSICVTTKEKKTLICSNDRWTCWISEKYSCHL